MGLEPVCVHCISVPSLRNEGSKGHKGGPAVTFMSRAPNNLQVIRSIDKK